MRPRPEGRGERTADAADAMLDAGFNAATARRPWRTGRDAAMPRAPAMLQCGHGPKAVENRRLRAWSSRRTQLQCGHGPKAVENRHAMHGCRSQCVLQCGHGPKAVENSVPAGRRCVTE